MLRGAIVDVPEARLESEAAQEPKGVTILVLPVREKVVQRLGLGIFKWARENGRSSAAGDFQRIFQTRDRDARDALRSENAADLSQQPQRLIGIEVLQGVRTPDDGCRFVREGQPVAQV